MEQTAPTSRRHHELHELIAVVLLALVAVMTAWCGFQSTKWGGDSDVAFSEASNARIEAADADGEARDARSVDLAIYTQWIIAGANGETGLADYIEVRFSPEFQVAFDAWVDDGKVETGPFKRAEYVPQGSVEAKKATERARVLQAEALTFNDKGDNYSLMTVMFALVLFLSAIAQRGGSVLATRIVLVLAGTLTLAGLIVLFTFPVRF